VGVEEVLQKCVLG